MGNGAPEVEISGLAYSSASVSPGTLFFCVPGFTADGHDFAADAVERGAVALVCERPLGLGVPEVVVDDVRAAMGPAAARFHGDPTAELRVVGITGTNGKTTTAFLVRDAARGRRASRPGLLGTVKQVVGGVEEPVERTTPEAIDLQATFRRMLDARRRRLRDGGLLARARARAARAGIRFACRGLHQPDPGPPRLPRRRWRPTSSPSGGCSTGPGAASIVERRRRVRRRGSPASSTRAPIDASAIERTTPTTAPATCASTCAGARFTVDTPDGAARADDPAARPVQRLQRARRARHRAHARRRRRDAAAPRSPSAGRVPGRFEPVEEGQRFGVLVDYAHTPDSLENVLRAARELTDGAAARRLRRRRRPRPRASGR